MVVAAHTAWVSGGTRPGAWVRPYQARFDAAIVVFFMISGFLLYRPFVRARLLDVPPPSLRRYGEGRVLRIVPAFWVALIVVAIWLGGNLWTPQRALINFGFLQLYGGSGQLGGAVIPQAWTLGTEVGFYAWLPAWVWLMRRLPARGFSARVRLEVVGVSAVVAGSLAYNAVLVYSHAVSNIPYAPTPALAAMPGYMDHIGLGMLLAVVSVWTEARQRDALPQPLGFLARFPSVCWLIAATAFWVGATRIGLTGSLSQLYTPTQYMARHLLNSVIAVAVVIPAVFGDPRHGLTRRILGNRALVYLGLVSYSFYLYHFAVIQQLLGWHLAGLHVLPLYARWFLATSIGALILGTLSYILVERPALSLKARGRARRGGRRIGEVLAEPGAVPAGPPPPAR